MKTACVCVCTSPLALGSYQEKMEKLPKKRQKRFASATYKLFSLSSKSPPIHVHAKLNNQMITMEHNTGVTYCMMEETIFCLLFSHSVQVDKCDISLSVFR